MTAHFVLVVQAKRVELAFAGGDFVYSGDAQAPEVTGVPKACEGDLRVRYYGTGGTHCSSSEAPTDAGTYRAVATLRSNGYIGAASRKFKIAPAKLKVKVDDAERFEGEMNPAFTSSLKSSADTSGVKVEYPCVADESSPAGEYQIEATVTDPNFDVTVEPGTLTVKKQEPVNPDPVVPDPDKPEPDQPDQPDPGKPEPDKPEPDQPDKPDPENPDKPEPDNPSKPEPEKPGTPDSDQPDSKDPTKPGSSDDSAADKAKASGAENSGKKESSKSSAQQLADMGDRAPLAVAVAAGAVALVALGLELLRRRRSDA